MSDALILQFILTISTYCGINAPVNELRAKECVQRLWHCSHKVKDARAIVTELHNCITKDLEVKP